MSMDELHEILLEISTTLSPSSLDAYLTELSSDLRRGSCRSLDKMDAEHLRILAGRLISLWDPDQNTIDDLCGFARGVAAALDHKRSSSQTEFVWTGPRSSQVHPRRSEQVLLDLIDEATERLLIVSYVTLATSKIYDRLNAAIDRSVQIKILLESSTAFGGRLDEDQVCEMRRHVPSAQYYRWMDRVDEFLGGRVHAKVFVADRSRALLTSANLTGNAMEKNMEAGILVTGGRLPVVVADHFDELIRNGVLSFDGL